MITCVYVDGFNLYYRALRDTPFRWLNLYQLAQSLFPSDSIASDCYSTARLQSRSDGPAQAQRQLKCLRALDTLPALHIHYGTFRSRVIRRPLAQPVPGLPMHVSVKNAEEKDSDVNLATRLLVDWFSGSCEQAVIFYNDADFAAAIRCVRDELGLRVVQVNPDLRNPSPEPLVESATYVKRLRRSHLRRSQFPDTLTDAVGTITRPARMVTRAATSPRQTTTTSAQAWSGAQLRPRRSDEAHPMTHWWSCSPLEASAQAPSPTIG